MRMRKVPKTMAVRALPALAPLLALLLPACDATGPAPPDELRLTGTASATTGDGLEVECSIEGLVTSLRPEGEGWAGEGTGEVERLVDPGGARRYEFAATIGGPVSLDRGEDGRVELRFVGNQPAGAKAFWRALEVLDGEERESYRYEGAWSCAPLEVDEEGFTDTRGTAAGRWELAPR